MSPSNYKWACKTNIFKKLNKFHLEHAADPHNILTLFPYLPYLFSLYTVLSVNEYTPFEK